VYTVARASELTGVPRETLRGWEQRYALVEARASRGDRLYDDEAVRRMKVMRELVDAGWAPHEAARRIVDDVAAVTARGGDITADARIGELAACAEDFDVPRLEQALAAGFGRADLASVVDDWLLPSLVRLGAAWQRGVVSVAGEHFVPAAAHRRLAHVFQTLPPVPPGGPRVVSGLARGSRHELGVLAFSAVLRSRGVAVTYLGADLPLDAWVDTVRLLSPAAVALAAPTRDDVPAVREVVQALLPMTRVLLGGAHQGEVDGPQLLGHRAGEAAVALAAELA